MLTSTATIQGHTFLHPFLRPEGTVVDLGANRGRFASAITDIFNVRCISVEANPNLAKSIPNTPRVKVFNMAVSDTNAPVTFHLAENTEMSSVIASLACGGTKVSVPGQTLAGLLEMNQVDEVELLKVDIEGAEVQLFASTPPEVLRRIKQITIEFHDFLGAYPAAEVHRMAQILHNGGFKSIRFSVSNMNWLFYRPDACPMGLIRRAWITGALRNIRRAANRLTVPLPVCM